MCYRKNSLIRKVRLISKFMTLQRLVSKVPAMCNRTSCAQVHELPWGHWRIGNNREGTLSVFLTIYILLKVTSTTRKTFPTLAGRKESSSIPCYHRRCYQATSQFTSTSKACIPCLLTTINKWYHVMLVAKENSENTWSWR